MSKPIVSKELSVFFCTYSLGLVGMMSPAVRSVDLVLKKSEEMPLQMKFTELL